LTGALSIFDDLPAGQHCLYGLAKELRNARHGSRNQG
jgi:hypothetical protein